MVKQFVKHLKPGQTIQEAFNELNSFDVFFVDARGVLVIGFTDVPRMYVEIPPGTYRSNKPITKPKNVKLTGAA